MINVGIAGIGFMGMTHYNAYQKVRGAKVRALCEQDKNRLAGDWRTIKGNFGPQGTKMDLKGIDRYSELDELLADPKLDLIDVCLPPSLHAKVTIAALRCSPRDFPNSLPRCANASRRRRARARRRCWSPRPRYGRSPAALSSASGLRPACYHSRRYIPASVSRP